MRRRTPNERIGKAQLRVANCVRAAEGGKKQKGRAFI